EDRARRDPRRAEDAHRLALVALARPGSDHGIDFRLAFTSSLDAFEFGIADEIRAPDRLEQRAPVSGIGAARIDIPIVVPPARLARINPARHVAARADFRAFALRRHPGRGSCRTGCATVPAR